MDIRDYVLRVAACCLAGIAVAAPLIVVLHALARRAGRQRTRRQNIMVVGWAICAFLAVDAVVGGHVAHGLESAAGFEELAVVCHAEGAQETYSPDHHHKVVLFAIVCGSALTETSRVIPEASLAVSLLPENESITKDKRGNLFNLFMAFPGDKDSVSWADNSHVRIDLKRLRRMDQEIQKDGVTVQIRTEQ
jgi:hypothetical protein